MMAAETTGRRCSAARAAAYSKIRRARLRRNRISNSMCLR
jgi:hypothetical protein